MDARSRDGVGIDVRWIDDCMARTEVFVSADMACTGIEVLLPMIRSVTWW